MWPAFPASDYYGSSAPPRRHQPATGLPADQLAAGREGGHRGGSHVHSRTARQVRRPTMPLQLRHEYAAGLPHGLPTGDINQSRSSPHDRAGARRNPAIHQVPAGGSLLRGVHTLVHCRYTFPSRSPDPDHLTVLTRPGFVRAACRPPPRPRDQAALNFNRPAATSRWRCPFITARFESASWRSMSHPQASSSSYAGGRRRSTVASIASTSAITSACTAGMESSPVTKTHGSSPKWSARHEAGLGPALDGGEAGREPAVRPRRLSSVAIRLLRSASMTSVASAATRHATAASSSTARHHTVASFICCAVKP